MDIVERLRPGPYANQSYEKRLRQEAADEIERLRRIIWNLLDDGDEADRAAARAALKGDE